ncbi:MAG: PA14 domain-containing protein [Planctomycetes bacterium]|nr:PA14 domain-containing protein [Planctomycetota bacterium]
MTMAADDAPRDDGLPVGTGLLGEYYDHRAPLARLPRLEGLTPTFSRLDPTVDFADDDAFALPFLPDTFAALWSGWFLAERAGVYTFVVGSDDGSRLELDNAVVIENDGLHGYREVPATVELAEGFHVLRLTYFENHGAAACRLLVAPPGEPLVPAPTRLLFPRGAAPRDLPLVRAIVPPRAPALARVVVEGGGFSDMPSYNRVRVGEAEAWVLEATRDRLLVEVPEGTDGGELVVDVGGVVSPGAPFEVEGAFGLHGRYLHLGHDVTDFVPLPPGPVTLERLDGPLAFRHEGAFGLPFPPDTFAVTWTGTFFALRPGRHTFFLTSDDGSRLWVDGRLVIEHGGLHPATERAGEVVLGVGRHDVVVEFFENRGGAALVLEMQEADGPRRVVPRGRLEPPEGVRRRAAPRLVALHPAQAWPGDLVRLEGEALADPSVGEPAVTLGGAPLEVVSAGWSEVVVRVPAGVDSGPVAVRLGPLVTAPLRLEVLGHGLRGRYYDLPGPLDRLPELAGLAPTFERVDPVIDFGEDAAFDLPFPPDSFAVTWRGTFTAEVDGVYTFAVGSDDGSRLTVAGQRLLDDSGLHGYLERAAEVFLRAGPVPLELDYFENEGAAAVRLLYAPPGGGPRRVIPRLLLRPER